MEGEVSVPEVNVEEVIQALRATRESDTNLSALQKLNRHVACPGGLYTLSRFLQRSPDLEEVTTIWAVQLSVKNVKANGKWLSGDQTEECDESVRVMVDAFQERLAHFILQKKLKHQEQRYSGQGVRTEPGQVLEAVATLIDIKSSDTVDKVGGLSRDKYWKQWVHSKSVLSRPSRALFVDFACALLRSADQNMLSQLLMLRPLMGGLLCFLAGDPPSACLQVLQLLSSRVVQAQLPGSTAAPLPPRLGLAPYVQTADIGGGGLGLRSESGVKRILRLLPRLHPSGSIHHAQKLTPGHVMVTCVHSESCAKRILRLLSRLHPSGSIPYIIGADSLATAWPSLRLSV
eukprot:gene70-12890_t